MTEKQKKQLDFLLADFKAAKDEISRRSNLQKIVLTLLITFYAWFIPNFIQNSISSDKIVLLLLVVFLAYIFYDREAKEISRLGLIIRERIAKPVSKMLKVKSTKIIPTEVHESPYPTDKLTKRYDKIFNSIVFLVIPIFYLVLFACNKSKCF